MTPAFDPRVTEYAINWPRGTGAQTVNATAKDPMAEVEVEADFVSEGALDIPSPPPKTYQDTESDPPPTAIRIYVGGYSGNTYTIRNTYYD